MTTERRYTNVTIYRRVYREARPYWLHIFGLLVISLLSTPFALLTPLPLKIAVDSVLGNEPLPGFLQAILPAAAMRSSDALLVVVVVLFIAIALLTSLRGLCSQILTTYTGQKLVLDFRARLLSQAQRLSLSYHDARGTSDSLYRIQYDASAVKSIATNGVIPFVSSVFKLAVMIYVISRISMQLALVALVIAPVLFLTLRLYARRLRSGWRGVKKLDSAMMSVVQEVLGGIRVVKALAKRSASGSGMSGRARRK